MRQAEIKPPGSDRKAREAQPAPAARVTLATALLAAGTSWNAGNIGPVTSALSADFSVSLTAVGLLSGTVFFAGVLATTTVAPELAKRTGVAGAARLGCILCGAGNLLFALSPWFAGLLVARVLVGGGLGLALVLGPIFAREYGGVRLLGVFGAGVTLGMAAALGVGSVLEDAGVEWRVAFVASATAGVMALPFLPARMQFGGPERKARGPLRSMVRNASLWRVGLVYVGSFGVQLIVGAWLIHYLTEDDGMAVSVAGLLAFVMFGFSALARDLGGTLSARGVSPVVLVGIAPLLATTGLVAIAIDRSFAVALPAVVLMGIGFSTPYAVMMDEAQRLFPKQPLAPITVLQLAANAVPMVVIPIVGAALAAGSGEAALFALAAFCGIGGVANLKPAVPATDPAKADAKRSISRA
ncbi:MAG TPA: MFS transporter [Solirubrobacterales bacterium]|nr:MFS transporter [Solirubrobacterales bacterium]